ncbi:cytochrome P450 [Streptomyces sp. SAI-229]|uniref:cytochrome P450 n=1 Tax=Streptomyces sp. SAI-229 TaxID=3377731 RepID=UPI003C7BAB80
MVSETLRHSPPGWLFTRSTTRDVEFGGRRLPRGTTVLYSPYLLHHAPASFPDPERFRPERWLSGEDTGRPYDAMVPFSAGSRKCLGDSFAMAQSTVAVATIARRWRLRHPPGPVAPVRPAVTLGPRSLRMICEPRGGGLGRQSRGAGDNLVDHT